MIILSAEELAKAFVLKIKSLDNQLPINNLYKYFSHHRTKHKLIINLVQSILETKVDTDNVDISEENQANVPENRNWIYGVFILIGLFFLIIALFSKNQGKELQSDSEVDGKDKPSLNNRHPFDEIKESGFYLGFDYLQKKMEKPY